MEESIINEEQKNLKITQKLITSKIEDLNTSYKNLDLHNKESLEYAVNERIDDIERAEVYGNINIADRNLENINKELKMYKKILPKPFFAKIKFDDDFGDNTFYIGLKNIEKDEYDYMVLDWRTPVASLLYYSSLGKTSYTAPSGQIDVNLKLKRQFRLEPNKIVSYIDTNTKIDDNILQEILSKNTSSHMTNIVETIQEEQNKIIRRNHRNHVIINGVAGSGKTSIAMHRIAYVLFANNGNIKSNNILVVSPNKLFSSYIDEVLPELGEEPVSTITSSQLFTLNKLTPKNIESKSEMVESQFTSPIRKAEISLKFSIAFKHEVDEFLRNYDIAPFIKQLELSKTPISDLEIKAAQTNATNLDLNLKINKVIESILIRRFPKISITKRDSLKDQLVTKCKSLLTTQKIMIDLYENFNLTPIKFSSEIKFEDAPIYAYIKSNLMGCQQNYFIKHIFVDEMQDYDPFTLSLIKKIYPDAVMTLAGDYNQNITSCQNNLEFINELFPNVAVDNLDVSYRSTKEIIDFAQEVIGKNTNSEHIVRHGEIPIVKKTKESADLEKCVYEILRKYPKDKVAIIAKTEDEAKMLSKQFNDFKLINNEDDKNLLTSQYIITTIYLSKGLEYDRVIIPNVDNKNFSTELDKQNLYVASTRALHGLYVTYSKDPAEFIPKKYLTCTPRLSSTKVYFTSNELAETNTL